MKHLVPIVITATIMAADEDEKKVPPRHPLQRLNRLNEFVNEWTSQNLNEKQAAHWQGKFNRNMARMERRFEQCGFYDENTEHGDRERRSSDVLDDIDDEIDLIRYDRDNPIKGIKQICKGFAKWAKRYIFGCKKQPEKQVNRMDKWLDLLIVLLPLVPIIVG